MYQNSENNDDIIRFRPLLFLIFLVLFFSFYNFYHLKEDTLDIKNGVSRYLSKERDFKVFFNSKDKNSAEYKLFLLELKTLLNDLKFKFKDNQILSKKFSKEFQLLNGKTFHFYEDKIFHLNKALILFEQRITKYLLLNFLLLFVIPFVVFFLKYKRIKKKHFFKNISYFDLNRKSIFIGSDLYKISNATEETFSRLKNVLNENLINFEQSYKNGVETFSFPIDFKNYDGLSIILKLTCCGKIDDKVILLVEDSTFYSLKDKNEILLFEKNETPFVILDGRKIIVANNQFEKFIGKGNRQLRGSFLDHLYLQKTNLNIDESLFKRQIYLLLDDKFNRKIVFSKEGAYFWKGKQQQIFSITNIIDYSKEYDFLFNDSSIDLLSGNFEHIFFYILDKEKNKLINIFSKMNESVLKTNNTNLINIISTIEREIYIENWDRVMLKFLYYVTKQSRLDNSRENVV